MSFTSRLLPCGLQSTLAKKRGARDSLGADVMPSSRFGNFLMSPLPGMVPGMLRRADRPRCCGPQRATDIGLRSSDDVNSALSALTQNYSGVSDLLAARAFGLELPQSTAARHSGSLAPATVTCAGQPH